MSFGTLAHADVADGSGHQNSFRTFERAQHELDGELAAIFAPPDQLDSGSNLLRQRFGCGARAVGDDPFGEALGDNVFYLLTHKFFALVAELLLRLRVQQNDLSGHVYDHHGIGSGFQQAAVSAFHLFQVSLRTLADTDVADGSGHQNSFRTFEGAQHELDGELGTIFAPPDQLDSGSNLLGQGLS